MRSRNIKPMFFKDENLVELPFEYRLLFVGLWCYADKAGRFECRPKRIKMEIFPADDVDVEEGISKLISVGAIRVYQNNGKILCEIPGFAVHQRPHHTEAESVLPSFSDRCSITVISPLNTRLKRSDSLIPDSLIPEYPPNPPAGGTAAAKQAGFEEWFEDFWKEYPRKQGKAAAKRLAKRKLDSAERRQNANARLLIDRAEWARRKRERGIDEPLATTWLNREDFDEAPKCADQIALSPAPKCAECGDSGKRLNPKYRDSSWETAADIPDDALVPCECRMAAARQAE